MTTNGHVQRPPKKEMAPVLSFPPTKVDRGKQRTTIEPSLLTVFSAPGILPSFPSPRSSPGGSSSDGKMMGMSAPGTVFNFLAAVLLRLYRVPLPIRRDRTHARELLFSRDHRYQGCWVPTQGNRI
jgi:hypothetical protein